MDAEQVAQVRSFNRLITQRVGALEDSYLARGRPLAEARLLYEIGPAGAETRALRERLRLDSGYLSRLLRALEADRLVETARAGTDARIRQVRLTEKGRAEFEAYEVLSDELARSMLGELDPGERSRLAGAMRDVERLLQAGSIQLSPQDPASPDALECLRRYFAELASRFEGGFDPSRGGAEADREMAPPTGLFLVARRAGAPVGCAGLKLHPDGIAEIKRMWVSPGARGLGLARRMLRALETHAREAGATALRLDTNGALTEAQALYRREAFSEIPRFNDNPYAHHWFEKGL